MIITSQPNSNRMGPFGKSLLVGLCLLLAGVMQTAAAQTTLPRAPSLAPAAASSSESIPVDQQPLTIRKPIPPNIMLMLDDSGSMAWDVMPDWGNLSSHAPLDIIDSAVNGVYYNPGATYSPPPKADGTYWPDADFDRAAVNGFYDKSNSERHEVDLTTYNGDYDSSTSTSFYNGYPTGSSNLEYSISVVKGEYAAPENCPSGTRNSGSQDDYCYYTSEPEYFEFKWSGHDTWYVSKCNKEGVIYNKDGAQCIPKENVTIADGDHSWSCPDDTTAIGETTVGYGDNRELCVTSEYHFFTFSSNGVRHYVGKSGSCDDAGLSATVCVDPSQTTPEDPTVRAGMSGADVLQNVANWFSYYHTRILMAKSSLMNAFSGLNKDYRVGFGSLHNNGGFPDDVDTVSKAGHKLAEVEPFGNGAKSSDQKHKFWDWILDSYPHNGTPLRTALMSIGEYYQTSQPWESKNKVSGDTESLACRQSYAILTTDGFWNGSSPSVGNVDNTNGDAIKGPDGQVYQYKKEDPFRDTKSNTLADVAMYYWNNDLSPTTKNSTGIPNEVPTNNADPAFWQHMVTFTIGLGFTPEYKSKESTKDKTVTKAMSEDMVSGLFQWSQTGIEPNSLSDWDGWLEPSSDSLNNINDLVHAAVNGHGGFYSATNPQSFVLGLKSALDRASERTGSGASLAANSTQLKTGVMAYQAIYHTAIWTGELKAYQVNASTGEISTTAAWNAASQLPSAANRKIYTYNPDAASSVNRGYLAFKDDGTSSPRTPPSLSSQELASLGVDTASQAAMVDYLRGDSSNEQRKNGSLRNRTNGILGDIVDSQPVYVGAVDANEFDNSTFTGSSSFATFASNKSSRSGRVYVAANDGMLHAFDADTGKETYAYLPGAVITAGGISKLADPGYGLADDPHQYFNDGQLTVADVYFKGPGDSTAKWHSVLVGTTGRGLAKDVYALDITDPDKIKFLWERSAGDGKTNSDYIGQMTGKPIVAQIADGTKSKWVVLMGNGYNSANDTAALLQFDLSDGDLAAYTTNADTGNGLSDPAVWIDDPSNGISTMAYAGDMKGHVWSFQLGSTSGPALGGTGTSGSTSPAPDTSGTLLFTATDGTDAQPITGGMLVGRNPDTQDLWLFFGTGRYLSSDDLADTQVQTWYGIIVQSSNASLVSNLKKDGRDALAQRKIVAQYPGSTTKNADGTTTVTLPTRVVSLPHAKDSDTPSISGKSGWYIDLESPQMNGKGEATGYNQEGERMVTPNQFQGSLLVGTTRIPTSTDVCNPSGTGWIMAIEPFTGTNPDPSFFDINGDGVINSDDSSDYKGNTVPAAGVGFGSLPNNPIFVGGDMLTSFSNGSTSTIMTSGAGNNLERVSWREMVNP